MPTISDEELELLSNQIKNLGQIWEFIAGNALEEVIESLPKKQESLIKRKYRLNESRQDMIEFVVHGTKERHMFGDITSESQIDGLLEKAIGNLARELNQSESRIRFLLKVWNSMDRMKPRGIGLS